MGLSSSVIGQVLLTLAQTDKNAVAVMRGPHDAAEARRQRGLLIGSSASPVLTMAVPCTGRIRRQDDLVISLWPRRCTALDGGCSPLTHVDRSVLVHGEV
ncbi:hypothetical protein F5Y04DRAFT_285114 [Hypomontagnella monticulosa]|nr:hypothetical protein F5Y04DRAFT_285114 [Hypomontagnella monticulosa]